MTPNRPGARGCSRYHFARPRGLTGRPGAIFSRRRTAMCPEARTPDPVGMAGLSIIGDA